MEQVLAPQVQRCNRSVLASQLVAEWDQIVWLSRHPSTEIVPLVADQPLRSGILQGDPVESALPSVLRHVGTDGMSAKVEPHQVASVAALVRPHRVSVASNS